MSPRPDEPDNPAPIRIAGVLIDDIGEPHDLVAIHRQLCHEASAEDDADTREALVHLADRLSMLHLLWEGRQKAPTARETVHHSLHSLAIDRDGLARLWRDQLSMLPVDRREKQPPPTSESRSRERGLR